MLILLGLLTACSYDAPVDPDGIGAMLNVIGGTVVYPGEEVPGPVHVLLYDVRNPPIPQGTGRPVTLSSISPDDFVSESGLASAEYYVTEVPDGTYYVRALVDNDWDFGPLTTANTSATCGDEAGGYLIDFDSDELGTVTVENGELADGITILITRDYPDERPAFSLTPLDPIVQGGGIGTIEVLSTGIYSELLELEGPFDGSAPCQTAFVVKAIDADGDGLVDPHPNPLVAAKGYPDVWPRFYLRYDSEEFEDGEYYASEMPFLWQFAGISEARLDEMAATGETEVITTAYAGWGDLAVHYLPDFSFEPVEPPNLPVGEWSLTVANYSGQVWTLPNETADAERWAVTDEAFDPATQAQGLFIAAAE